MKKFKRFISILLVAAICLLSLPIMSVCAVAADAKKIIYQFEPGKTGQTAGQEVSMWDGFTVCPTYVRMDDDGYYYSTEIGPYSGQKYMSYGTGWTNETMPMLGNNDVMNKLTPFIEVSLDVRIVSESPGFSNNSLKIDILSFDSNTYYNFWHFGNLQAQTDGDWHTYTKTENSNNFYGGNIGKITYIINDVPVNCKVEVRNFKASVKESDASAINAVLDGTGYTYESITHYYPYVFKSPYHNILQVTPEITAQSGSVKSPFSEKIYSGFLNTVVEEEDAGKYYSVDYPDSANGGKWAFINTGWNAQINAPAWTNNQALINALIPYMNISVDVRAQGYNEDDEYFPVDNVSFMIHALDYWDADNFFSWWGDDPRTFNLVPGNTAVTADGEWHTITTHAGGSTGGNGIGAFNLFLDISNNSNHPIFFDFKNLVIRFKESDMAEINDKLAEINSTYTYSDLVSFQSYYKPDTIIWYADSNKANKIANNNGNVSTEVPAWIEDWQLTKAYDTFAQNNSEDGAYYHTEMHGSGNAGAATNTLVQSGISAKTRGYGWLSNVEVLNALRPYMNVGLQYRATNSGGSNYSIFVRPVNIDSYAVQYGQICDYMTQIDTTALDNWCQKDYSAFAHNFTRNWNDGNFAISIYSADGNIAGEQDIDVRDLNIAIASANRENINSALSKIDGIDNITNFTAGITLGKDEYGNKDYFSLLASDAHSVEMDANDDEAFNLLDLVAAKKYLANGFIPKYVISRIDIDGDGSVLANDLTAIVTSLLTQVTARNDFIIGLEQDHPGVAEMDAKYTMTISDKSGNPLSTADFNWSANSDDVQWNGAEITVPYGIRMSSKDLVVTATSKTDASLSATYTFNFQKYSSNSAFSDDFDGNSLNTDLWNVVNDGNISVSDGKLSLSPSSNNSKVQLSTENKFSQTFGSFTARMKIPSSNTGFTAFWLMNYGGYYIDPNFPNNSEGEIDILEYLASDDVYMTSVHWNGYIAQDGRPANQVSVQEADYYCRSCRFVDNTNSDYYKIQDPRYIRKPGLNVKDGQYHDVSSVWTKDGIYWYLDGELIYIHTGEGVGQGDGSMFMFLDYTGLASETLSVDSVKVYGLF